MKVFILPGGASPHSTDSRNREFYSAMSAVLQKVSPSTTVTTIAFPGQTNVEAQREGELVFSTSLKHVNEQILSCADPDTRLLCTCYGCVVGAAICADLPHLVRRALFWGPVPMWKSWQMCAMAENAYAGREEIFGVAITRNIFEGWIPFECSIKRVHFPVTIAWGTEDRIAPSSTFDCFKALVAGQANVRLEMIEGCGHTVEATGLGWEIFVGKLIGWLTQ